MRSPPLQARGKRARWRARKSWLHVKMYVSPAPLFASLRVPTLGVCLAGLAGEGKRYPGVGIARAPPRRLQR
jgi:hypothetical protein